MKRALLTLLMLAWCATSSGQAVSDYKGYTAAQLSAMTDYVTIPNTAYWNTHAYLQLQLLFARANVTRLLTDYPDRQNAIIDTCVVIVPPDTVLLTLANATGTATSRLDAESNMAIIGYGKASVLKVSADTTTADTAAAAIRILEIYDEANVLVQNITFVTDTTHECHFEQSHAITISNSDNIIIDNCDFYCSADGISIQWGSNDIYINNCRFWGDSLRNFINTNTSASRNGIAIGNGASNIHITNCYFNGFRVGAIDIETTGTGAYGRIQNVTIADNVIKHGYGGGISLTNNEPTNSYDIRNVAITGNVIDSTKSNPIILYGAPGLIENVTITGNVIRYGTFGTTSHYPAAIYGLQNTRSITISGNALIDCPYYGIEFQQSDTTAARLMRDIVITGNTIRNAGGHGISLLGNDGNYIRGISVQSNLVDNAGIDGHTYKDPQYAGIRVARARLGSVSNNTVCNTTTVDSLWANLNVNYCDSLLVNGNVMTARGGGFSLGSNGGNTQTFYYGNWTFNTYGAAADQAYRTLLASSGWLMISGITDTSRYGYKDQQNAWKTFTRRDGALFIAPFNSTDTARRVPRMLDSTGVSAGEGYVYVSHDGDSLKTFLNSAWRTLYPTAVEGGKVDADSITTGAGGVWMRNFYQSGNDIGIVFYNAALSRIDTVFAVQP